MNRSLQFLKNHTGLFSKWLLPYFILLIVPLIINIYTYFMMNKVVYEQTISTNALALSQAKQSVDKVLSEVHQAYIQLFYLDILKKDYVSDDPSSYKYDTYKTMESLRTISVSYPSISGFVLYDQAADFIITLNNASSSRSYYDASNPLGNATYEEFLHRLQDKYSGSLVEAQITSQDGTPERALIYQKTITDTYMTSYRYNCFFILEDRVLYNQLQQTDLFQDGLFAIVDDQDTHIITAQGDKNLQSDLIARLQGAESDSSIIVSDTKSEIFDLHYYMLMPQNNFWAETRIIFYGIAMA